MFGGMVAEPLGKKYGDEEMCENVRCGEREDKKGGKCRMVGKLLPSKGAYGESGATLLRQRESLPLWCEWNPSTKCHLKVRGCLTILPQGMEITTPRIENPLSSFD